MTHLNIQQGQNIEVVSTNLIKKLYEAALSVPEPLEGEQDAAYMSGNLQVDKSYRAQVEYLTNRFDDLHINVTVGYYMLFHDSAVNDVLKNTIGDGIGVLESQLKAANPKDSELGLANNTDIVDTRELCLIEGTDLIGGFLTGCSNITTIGIPCNATSIRFNTRSTVNNIVVKNIKNFLNAWIPYNYNFNRNQSGWDLYTTSDGSNIQKVETLTIPSGVTFQDNNEYAPLYKCKSVTTLNVPNTQNTLGGCRYSYLQNLIFEQNSSLSKICSYAFEQCTNLSLNASNLPSTITTIGTSAFYGCTNLTGTLNLPNLTTLGNYAFYAAGITSITDLGSISIIDESAFQNCSNLNTVYIPSTLTYLGRNSFTGCAIRNIVVDDIWTLINCHAEGDTGFYGGSTAATNAKIYIGSIDPANELKDAIWDGTKYVYYNAAQWKFYHAAIQSLKIINVNGNIPGSFAQDCKNLKKIDVREGVTEIGYHCFEGSGPFEEIWLPTTFTGFGNDAFKATSSNNNKIICLSMTPPTKSNFAPSGTYYCPDSVVADYGASWIGTSNVKGLSELANISDNFKNALVDHGCTATGSTGNWTILAP